MFKRAVRQQYPAEGLEIRVSGSNARGDAIDESDIDVLVVTNSDGWRVGDAMRRFGYDLDAEIGCQLSIQVLPVKHTRYLAENQFSFYRHVARDGMNS